MSSQVKVIVGVLILSVVAVVGAAFFLSRIEQRGANPIIILGDERNATGSAEPRLTIVEFSDFQCPACLQAKSAIDDILQKYPGEVRLVYRHFPLTSSHQHAFDAAVATEIAGAQGKFWAMHDLLFERQDQWADARDIKSLLSSYADELGLDRTAFLQSWDSRAHEGAVRSDMRDAEALGITATPTLFVNNKQVSWDRLASVVAESIK